MKELTKDDGMDSLYRFDKIRHSKGKYSVA